MTGGTGYIGRAVAAELISGGHDVASLARSDTGRDVLAELGAGAVAGDLTDAASYRDAAARADAVIHLGFDYRAPVESDVVATETLLEATAGRESRVVGTSGLWVVGDTRGKTLGDDAPTDDPAEIVAWRVPHERLILDGGGARRTTAVVRPGYVYGRGGGFTGRMFATAVKTGAAEYVGDGTNRWNSIHVADLARLYRRVVESGAGGVFQAVDGTPETVVDIAHAASRAAGADGSVEGIPLETARGKLGPVADAMCLDQLLAAPAARVLGWEPEHVSFTAAAPVAFDEWVASRRS